MGDACGASASPVVGNGWSIDAQRSGWEESAAFNERGGPPAATRTDQLIGRRASASGYQPKLAGHELPPTPGHVPPRAEGPARAGGAAIGLQRSEGIGQARRPRRAGLRRSQPTLGFPHQCCGGRRVGVQDDGGVAAPLRRRAPRLRQACGSVPRTHRSNVPVPDWRDVGRRLESARTSPFAPLIFRKYSAYSTPGCLWDRS